MNLILSQLLSSLLLLSPLHTLPVCRVSRRCSTDHNHRFLPGLNISLVNFDLFNFEDVSPTLKQPEIMSLFKIRVRGNGCDPKNIDRHSIITAGCEECDWTAEKSWTHNSPAAVDHVWRESHDYQEPVEAYEKRQDLNWTADLIRFLFKHNSKLSTDNWHRFTKCRLGSYYQIKGYCKE